MKIVIYILVILVALILGYYIYQIKARKNPFKPNIVPIFAAISKEYENNDKIFNSDITDEERNQIINRKQEIQNLINKFTGNE